LSPNHDDIEQAALALAVELAHDAIDIARGDHGAVAQKADALDVVTDADVRIERHFRQCIEERFPEHAILGEEEGLDPGGRDWTWVVDPIDGTFNLVTGLPGVATSIALMHGDEARVGVIGDFGLATVFSSRKGNGMTWEGGWPPGSDPGSAEIGQARLFIDSGHQAPDARMFAALQGIAELAPVVPRLIGSAAVSLAAVALNGGCFVGAGLELWDAAAGVLLVEERGHSVRCWRFADDSQHHVLAGEPRLVRHLEPAMLPFIEAWRDKLQSSGSAVGQKLLGPSSSGLV
jgi:myo-inositol-1(or 4)-monophosphatase